MYNTRGDFYAGKVVQMVTLYMLISPTCNTKIWNSNLMLYVSFYYKLLAKVPSFAWGL